MTCAMREEMVELMIMIIANTVMTGVMSIQERSKPKHMSK